MFAYAPELSQAPQVPTIGLNFALPQLVAHRGNAAEFPENTLPALRSALEMGIKYLALDVQLTKDQVPVVAKRHSLAGTTNCTGSIFDLNAAELAQVRVGEPARFGHRFADVGMPTLTQAAELLAAFPSTTMFVDIQSASLQQFGHELVVQRVGDCLRSLSSQVVLVASELPTVEFIRRSQNFRNGWIVTEYSRLSVLKSEAIAPDFLFCDRSLLPNDTSRLWRGPWRWAVSEVHSHAQAMQLMARGADLILTTEVRALLRELRQIKKRD